MGTFPAMSILWQISRGRVTMLTLPGATIQANGQAVTPLARARELRWGSATLVSHRPVGVAVRHEGRTSQSRIIDVTWLVQAAIVLGVAIGACWLWARSTGRKEIGHGRGNERVLGGI